MGRGLSSARSAVREPNYGPEQGEIESEIEWELKRWIAGLMEVSTRLYRS